jgi:hypothetical protein
MWRGTSSRERTGVVTVLYDEYTAEVKTPWLLQHSLSDELGPLGLFFSLLSWESGRCSEVGCTISISETICITITVKTTHWGLEHSRRATRAGTLWFQISVRPALGQMFLLFHRLL